jgi:hypothetical protein
VLEVAGRDPGPIETDLHGADDHERRGTARRPLIAAGAVVVVAALVAWAVRASGETHRSTRKTPVTTAPQRISTDRGDARARQLVAAAAETTTNIGSFHVVYRLSEQAAGSPNAAACQDALAGSGVPGPGGDGTVSPLPSACTPHDVTVTGDATVDTNPKALRAVSNVSSLGAITLIADESDVWEFGGANYGSDGVSAGPGAPFSHFAGLVEGTLGRREGALAMQSMASPNGYLSITKATIATAQPIGAGTFDGIPVTNFRVTLDPAATPTGVSPDEAAAIAAAREVLAGEGFVHTVQDVSIDAMGYVRRARSVAVFRDGGTITTEDTFSQFGCAGAVAVPGRSVGSPPGPPDCVVPPPAPPAATSPTTVAPSVETTAPSTTTT